jgi:hypothetical protein
MINSKWQEFYYVASDIATIKHRCVALLYKWNSIEQCASPNENLSAFLGISRFQTA